MAASGEIASLLGGVFQTRSVTGGQASRTEKSQRAKRAAESGEAARTEADPKLPPLGVDVDISAIEHDVLDALGAMILDVKGAVQSLEASAAFSARLDAVFERSEQSCDIVFAFDDLGRAFLNGQRQDALRREEILARAGRLLETLKTVSGQLTRFQEEVLKDLAETLSAANRLLAEITLFNHRIALSSVQGGVDQANIAERAARIEALNDLLEFSSFSRSDHSLSLSTLAGTPLLDGSPQKLSLDRREGAPAFGEAGVTIGDRDISGEIRSGRISGLLRVKDQILPNLNSALDTLAQTLLARLNQAANRALGAGAARSLYRGSHGFSAPKRQFLSLGGGDSLLTLFSAARTEIAATTVRREIKNWRIFCGKAPSDVCSASDLAAAINHWLEKTLDSGKEPCLRLDEKGCVCIRLPEGAALAISDHRSQSLLSGLAARPDQALGLTGDLRFSDSSGNLFKGGEESFIRLEDTLESLRLKISLIDGIEASLVPDGDKFRLLVQSRQGTDLVAEPDGKGFTAATGLRFLPDPDGLAEDVAIAFNGSGKGLSLLSRPFDSAETPMGATGLLFLESENGRRFHLALDPSWSAATLTRTISQTGAPSGLSSTLYAQGNRVAARIIDAEGGRLESIVSPGALATLPGSPFVGNGGRISLFVKNRLIGEIDVVPGMGLEDVKNAVNAPGRPFAAAGIFAKLRDADDAPWLEIAQENGLVVTAGGSATGPGATERLHLLPNGEDWLGLYPAAEQIVTGFANFLGLNDIFIADPESDIDGKAPTGLFDSTAAPGTAASLTLNPALLEQEAPPLDDETIERAAALLNSPVNIAAAGDLPRRQASLAQYAQAIVESVHAQSQTAQRLLVYNQIYLAGLASGRGNFANADMDDEIRRLGALRQSCGDASKTLSTIGPLLQKLEAG